jgi:hypothetical protein
MIDSSTKTLGRVTMLRQGNTKRGSVFSFTQTDELRELDKTLRRKRREKHRTARKARRVNR